MLKNTLFQIDAATHRGGTITATLALNKNSCIFSGHFPGQPVLPGACMFQMVKEVTETTLRRTLRLQKAAYLKFMSLVDPVSNPMLQLTVVYQQPAGQQTMQLTAELRIPSGLCFKCKGTFITEGTV